MGSAGGSTCRRLLSQSQRTTMRPSARSMADLHAPAHLITVNPAHVSKRMFFVMVCASE